MTQGSQVNDASPADTQPKDTALPIPTIGVDPGQTWTGVVLRVGGFGEHGWTLGPVDKYGMVTRDALNEMDNWAAFQRKIVRLIDGLDALTKYAIAKYGEVRVAVEVPLVPVGFREDSAGARRFQRMRYTDWIMPRQVAAAVIGQYPEARLVRPDGFGSRDFSEYPKELRGARPPDWGPCEAPRGDRNHERAAYDIAGVASLMPR